MVNANREYFETGAKDMAQAILEYGDWLSRLLTHPFAGLENHAQLFDALTRAKDVIKVYCEVGEETAKLMTNSYRLASGNSALA